MATSHESIYLSYAVDEKEEHSPFDDSNAAAATPARQQSRQPSMYASRPRGKSLAGAQRPNAMPTAPVPARALPQQQTTPMSQPPMTRPVVTPQAQAQLYAQQQQQQLYAQQQQQFAQQQYAQARVQAQQQQHQQQQRQHQQQRQAGYARPQLAIQVRAPSPAQTRAPLQAPHAAFAQSPVDAKGSLTPTGSRRNSWTLSPVGGLGSATSSHSLDEADRFAMASNVGSNVHADFWKRFSMVLHDKDAEKPVEQKDKWLRRELVKKHKYKIMIWGVALLVVIGIAAGLAYYFTHKSDNADTTPSQHDFGLGGASSGSASSTSNPLTTIKVGIGYTRRSDIPSAPLATAPATVARRMHKLRRHAHGLSDLD